MREFFAQHRCPAFDACRPADRADPESWGDGSGKAERFYPFGVSGDSPGCDRLPVTFTAPRRYCLILY